MAVAEAARAAMAIRRSNRCTSSSRTKTAPAIGALKAAPRPAPAPAAINTRQSGHGRRNLRPTKMGQARPHLDTGALAPKRQAGANGQQSADEFHRDRRESDAGGLAAQNGFDVRDAASRRVRREAANQPGGERSRRPGMRRITNRKPTASSPVSPSDHRDGEGGRRLEGRGGNIRFHQSR